MKQKLYIILAIILLVILFVFALHLIIRDYRYLRGDVLSSQPHSFRNWYGMHQRYTPSVSNVDSIRSWMTFNYLNRVFNLPPDYLKTKLNVSDSKYPNITVEKVIKEKKEAENSYLEKLKTNIRLYLSPPNPQ